MQEKVIGNRRVSYLLLAIVATILGLGSRTNAIALPEFIVQYGGDTFWALCAFWLVRAIAPSTRVLASALIALGFSFVIEFFQLYKAPWIDSIRATTIGALALGHGFKFSDLVCYSVGILIGVAIELLAFGARRKYRSSVY